MCEFNYNKMWIAVQLCPTGRIFWIELSDQEFLATFADGRPRFEGYPRVLAHDTNAAAQFIPNGPLIWLDISREQHEKAFINGRPSFKNYPKINQIVATGVCISAEILAAKLKRYRAYLRYSKAMKTSRLHLNESSKLTGVDMKL
jgi:hypothetical protein